MLEHLEQAFPAQHLVRALHGQAFVGLFIVELADEVIELGWLLNTVGGLVGRVASLLRVGCMCSWRPVLLRMTGLDPFDSQSEAKPPDGESAQIEKGVGGRKGYAIVGADRSWQSAFLEQSFEG